MHGWRPADANSFSLSELGASSELQTEGYKNLGRKKQRGRVRVPLAVTIRLVVRVWGVGFWMIVMMVVLPVISQTPISQRLHYRTLRRF